MQQRLARWLEGALSGWPDGAQLALGNCPGCDRRRTFAGFARSGYHRSQHRFLWEATSSCSPTRGLPLGSTIVPANEKEYEPLGPPSGRRERRGPVAAGRT